MLATTIEPLSMEGHVLMRRSEGHHPSGVLFPGLKEQFLILQESSPVNVARHLIGLDGISSVIKVGDVGYIPQNQSLPASLPDQSVTKNPDVLLRLPSLKESKWKVTVLQQWVGRVERIERHTFYAVLNDATNSQNPPEEVELEIAEISPSDLSLFIPGATFYWSIGYQDTPGGQRQRVSVLRIARRPRLSDSDVDRVLRQADSLADFLEIA
jgi:hypothetical protein